MFSLDELVKEIGIALPRKYTFDPDDYKDVDYTEVEAFYYRKTASLVIKVKERRVIAGL